MKKLTMFLLLVFLSFQTACFNQNNKSLETVLSKHLSSQHYNYYMSEGDNVDTIFQEKYFNWLIGKLKINIYNFKNSDSINQINYIDWLINKMVSKETDENRSDNAYKEEFTNWIKWKFIYLKSGKNIDTIFQRNYLEWLKKEKVNEFEKINFYKFKNNKQMKSLTGYVSNGLALPWKNSFYCVWPADNHESVHIMVYKYIGLPCTFFDEGIAVALQSDLKDTNNLQSSRGSDITIEAKYYYKHSKIPELDTLLNPFAFRKYDEFMTYPVAGSFVCYLINNYGIEKFKNFISLGQPNAKINDLYQMNLWPAWYIRDIIYNKFSSVYNIALKKAWSDWFEYLIKYKQSINYDTYYQDLMSHYKNLEKNKNN